MHNVITGDARRALQARSHVSSDREPRHPSGSVFKSAVDCQYPPAVLATDILHVDLDIQAVSSDGLYLVEMLSPDGRRVEWRGCRRFAVTKAGLQVDVSGAGEWTAANLQAWRMRVAGKVLAVYRSTHMPQVGAEVCHG
ncbi:hypothetical protein [Burkholderia gladioli]|uniref:hypothetical protein n=1 Tax=Burkholderia gladioli TaxID=28095 RepID=UPI000CFFBF7D|nr:hypothetical protein [Burkholderia gladioli]PRE83797.1 hypothetical protein C6Q13_18705 [Burkholderia gladioli]